MKDCPISKLTITTLPVLCADKNFQGVDEVLLTGLELVGTDFMLPYPDASQLSTTNHEQISTLNLLDVPLAYGSCSTCFVIIEQTHVFDTNFQKELLLDYKRDSKNKSQEYTKFLADKKALITILFEQCDQATKTKIALGAT